MLAPCMEHPSENIGGNHKHMLPCYSILVVDRQTPIVTLPIFPPGVSGRFQAFPGVSGFFQKSIGGVGEVKVFFLSDCGSTSTPHHTSIRNNVVSDCLSYKQGVLHRECSATPEYGSPEGTEGYWSYTMPAKKLRAFPRVSGRFQEL